MLAILVFVSPLALTPFQIMLRFPQRMAFLLLHVLVICAMLLLRPFQSHAKSITPLLLGFTIAFTAIIRLFVILAIVPVIAVSELIPVAHLDSKTAQKQMCCMFPK